MMRTVKKRKKATVDLNYRKRKETVVAKKMKLESMHLRCEMNDAKTDECLYNSA